MNYSYYNWRINFKFTYLFGKGLSRKPQLVILIYLTNQNSSIFTTISYFKEFGELMGPQL